MIPTTVCVSDVFTGLSLTCQCRVPLLPVRNKPSTLFSFFWSSFVRLISPRIIVYLSLYFTPVSFTMGSPNTSSSDDCLQFQWYVDGTKAVPLNCNLLFFVVFFFCFFLSHILFFLYRFLLFNEKKGLNFFQQVH